MLRPFTAEASAMHSYKRQLLTVHVVAVGWDCKTVSCNAYEVVDRHGCHCPGDMAVRTRKVLAIPRSCVV